LSLTWPRPTPSVSSTRALARKNSAGLVSMPRSRNRSRPIQPVQVGAFRGLVAYAGQVLGE
jgi:hypothetical protein